jgi:hypothetical protein
MQRAVRLRGACVWPSEPAPPKPRSRSPASWRDPPAADGISAGTMRRPSRGHCWSAPISADSACNIGRPKRPTPSWGGRCSNPGENSGSGSDISWRPSRACAAARNRERCRKFHQGWCPRPQEAKSASRCCRIGSRDGDRHAPWAVSKTSVIETQCRCY